MIPSLLRFSPKFLFLCAALLLGCAASFVWGRSTASKGATSIALPETLYVEAKARTDTVTQTVTQLVTRWRTDTAYRADTVTLRDTLRVLVPLAQFDSTIKACSELASSCQRERQAAERLQTALRDSIASLQPSKWGPVKTALVFGAGLYLGSKVLR